MDLSGFVIKFFDSRIFWGRIGMYFLGGLNLLRIFLGIQTI